MSREVTIVTPENVSVTYQLSGIGSRFLALALDTVMQFVASVAVILVASFLALRMTVNWAQMARAVQAQSTWVFAGMIIGVFLIAWGYFIFFETIWNGQTPGKRLVRLRVVREGGQPVDLACAATRNLMRYLDFLPALYTVGLISIFFSPRYKRLGDYAAGTIVVKERSPHLVQIKPRTEPRHGASSAIGAVSIDALSPGDLAAIRRFAQRREELPLETQEQVARTLTAPIMAKLGLASPPDTSFSHADFLEALYALDRERQSFR